MCFGGCLCVWGRACAKSPPPRGRGESKKRKGASLNAEMRLVAHPLFFFPRPAPHTPLPSVGLDVFEHEPAMAPGLAACPNAVIVPHIASASLWTRGGMASLAAANVAARLRGAPAWTGADLLAFV